MDFFFYEASILPSSLVLNGPPTVPEKLRQLFDRVGTYKLNKLFPNELKEAIQKLLANAWKQLCNYDLWVALYLQGIRYTR